MDKHAKRLSSLSQLISMIPRDKPPRMLVKLQTLRLRESLTSQPPLPLLSVSIRLTERSLLSTILEVELSISLFSKSPEEFSRLSQPTEILPSEERISIFTFKSSLSRSSNPNTVWTLQRISLPFKELERLLRRPRLSFLPQTRLR